MGLMKDQSDGKEPDSENDPEKREEDYQKMFMKMGRDFVHRDDFERTFEAMIDILLIALPPIGIILKASPLPHRSNRAAQAKAAIYKEALDEGDVVPFAEDDLEEIGGEDE